MERFEIDKEVEEKVNQILQKLIKLPLEKILSYALKGEEDAIQLYKFLSQKLEEPHAKMKFEEFIKNEKEHKEGILRIFNELFPNKKPIECSSATWVEISTEITPETKPGKDYLEVLKVAIQAEKLAEEIYKFIADSLPYEEYKNIFSALAEEEREHYEFLKGQYRFYKRAKAEEDMHEMMDKLLREE
ncbi:MAG: ferritin family protein [Thermococcus sp.]|uniref:ferritin family protein n=1 Tax=Thermococcus sp. TaxID=35749 RepID=UPI001D58D7E4|nr:ferritin family protein [Thermococcus sp.]MBO8175025.1 ferritin family protein [Thermococcus sp.]